MRAALYARVSTPASDKRTTKKGGDRERQDPEFQLIKLRTFAQSRGYEVVKEYTDRKSGADPNRPAFQEMIKDAFAHKFDFVLVTKIDRMARSLVNLQNSTAQLDSWGIGVVFIDQQMETKSPAGRLMFQIFGAFAEFEREMIRERVLDGMEIARSKGKKFGRPPKTDISDEAIKEAYARVGTAKGAAREIGIAPSTLRDRLKKMETEKGTEKEGGLCL